jgi:hypothetical protein
MGVTAKIKRGLKRLRMTASELALDLMPNGVLQAAGLAKDATAEKFKTTATLYWRRLGIQFSKTAATALTFTANHVVTASKFGIILVQVSDTGTISTKVPGATQTTAMAYATAAAALAALPDPDAGNTPIGYIAIAAKAATWTANTDDLTDGSDVTTATFVSYTAEAAPAGLL